VKKRIFAVIRDNSESPAGRAFSTGMSVLIVVNVLFVLVDTMREQPSWLQGISWVVEVISVALFTIEYLLRVWTADLLYPELGAIKARLRYVVSGMAIIDLLSILPFYLPMFLPIDLRILRVLRLLRLLRVFKLARYSTAMASTGRVLKQSGPALLSSLSVVAMLMLVASVLMYYIEGPAQPEEFSNAFSALWWAMATITTVGYGDIYPVTVLGKILSAVIAILGIALVAIPTGIISAGFMTELSNSQHPKPAGSEGESEPDA
jgi:voltage-gated potassium channel